MGRFGVRGERQRRWAVALWREPGQQRRDAFVKFGVKG